MFDPYKYFPISFRLKHEWLYFSWTLFWSLFEIVYGSIQIDSIPLNIYWVLYMCIILAVLAIPIALMCVYIFRNNDEKSFIKHFFMELIMYMHIMKCDERSIWGLAMLHIVPIQSDQSNFATLFRFVWPYICYRISVMRQHTLVSRKRRFNTPTKFEWTSDLFQPDFLENVIWSLVHVVSTCVVSTNDVRYLGEVCLGFHTIWLFGYVLEEKTEFLWEIGFEDMVSLWGALISGVCQLMLFFIARIFVVVDFNNELRFAVPAAVVMAITLGKRSMLVTCIQDGNPKLSFLVYSMACYGIQLFFGSLAYLIGFETLCYIFTFSIILTTLEKIWSSIFFKLRNQ